MFKRGIPLLLVVAASLLSLLAGSVNVSAVSNGDPCWESTNNQCTYGTWQCAWYDPACWWTDTCVGSTETCSKTVGSVYSVFGNGYTTTCTYTGCQDVISYDCNSKDGCSNNMYDDYSYNYFGCDKSTSCKDVCCPPDYTCQGSPATCLPIKKPCSDNDKDGYGNPGQDNCPSGSATDCNDFDNTKWQFLSGYVDKDGDGFTVGSAVSVCSGSSLPSGYAAGSKGEDCDDGDASLTTVCDVKCGSNGINTVTGLCDSRCGASSSCNKKALGSDSGFCNTATHQGQVCNDNCQIVNGKCSYTCGAAASCSGLMPGSGTKYCQEGTNKQQICDSGCALTTSSQCKAGVCGAQCDTGKTSSISCGSNLGVCKDAKTTAQCDVSTCTWGAYGACSASPSAEVCDSKDNDCDGAVDEGFSLLSDVNNCGSCGNKCISNQVCDNGVCKDSGICVDNDMDDYGNPASSKCKYPQLDCNDYDASVFPGSCSSGAVTWASPCSASTAGGCGTGECKRTVPESCLCGNGIVDAGEECDGVNLNGKSCQVLGFGGGTLSCYPKGTAGQCSFDTTGCTSCGPGTVKPGSRQCSLTVCNQATEKVCNTAGTAYDVTKTVTDGSCLFGCGATASCTPAVQCSSLGCGQTDSCGNYCGDCQAAPSPTNDPCAGISNPDLSQACCTSKGFRWAKSGEAKLFGGFTGIGQYGCVGDDLGEYLRFRECEGAACSTNAADSAACASVNSCVLNTKCYARLDRAAEEPEIAALVQNCQGTSSGDCVIVNQLYDAATRAKSAQSREDKRKIAKDEIAPKIAELTKLGKLKEAIMPTGTTGSLLCLPR